MNSYQCKGCNAGVQCTPKYFRMLPRKNPEQICRKCRLRGKLAEYNAKYQVSEAGRICATCGVLHSWEMFPGNGLAKNRKKNPHCKDCVNAAAKTRWHEDAEFKAKTRASSRASHLRRMYGISVQDYEHMLAAQGGVCRICGTGQDLCVDHCHATNRVRGILCRPCNKGIGIFRDSRSLLANAMEYLHDEAI